MSGYGNPGDMNRNPSHIVILSQDYKDEQKLVVCGHTTDQKDEEKTRNDRTCTYIHIISIRYDFEDADYADSEDRETAKLDWGGSILSTNSATSTYVRNLQTRLGHVFASPPHAQFVQGVDSTSVLSLNMPIRADLETGNSNTCRSAQYRSFAHS